MKALVGFILCLLVLKVGYSADGPYVGRDDALDLAIRLVNETQIIYDGILASKPYHPSLFAWGMHYLARTYLILYNLTGNMHWLDKALNITDYFARYSDVNGDGQPSWGSYNETWGIGKWEFKEYTVWDGVNALPMIEAAKLIKSRPDLKGDTELSAKADSYVDIVRGVVVRHYPYWTQVTGDQGYYWDDPSEDVGPYVNGFAALGHVELLLYDMTRNETYLERPRQMANYILANMRHNGVDDLYTWDYLIGSGPVEDISHGAIDLEFLLTANDVGLVDDQHVLRICNTYRKRIWQVPELLDGRFPLSMRVDGSGTEDYTALSRGWILLSTRAPEIYDQQRIALGVEHERHGLYPAGFVALAVAQIPLFAQRLESMDVEPSALQAVPLDQLDAMLDQTYLRLNQSHVLGANASWARSMLEEASEYANADSLTNASIPIALVWQTWEGLGRTLEVGERLRDLRGEIEAGGSTGLEVTALMRNLTRLMSDFSHAMTEAAMDAVVLEADGLSVNLRRAIAETMIDEAEEVVKKAKDLGIDTSLHEILLGRAYEEFGKGNYGPAIEFAKYPLRLLEQIRESAMPWIAASLLTLLLCHHPFSRGSPVLRRSGHCGPCSGEAERGWKGHGVPLERRAL